MAKRYWLWKGKAFCSLRKENHFLWEKKMSPTSLLSKTINTDINKSLPKRRQHCAQFHSQHIYLWEENLLFSSFISGSLPLRRCKNKEKKSVARAAEKCWWGTFHQLYNTQSKSKQGLLILMKQNFGKKLQQTQKGSVCKEMMCHLQSAVLKTNSILTQ